jgi:hypothetical protein
LTPYSPAPPPPSIHPSPLPQITFYALSHHSTPIYTYLLPFCTPSAPQLYSTLALPSCPPFRFFELYMAVILLPKPFPTLLPHYYIISQSPTPAWPIPSHLPAPTSPHSTFSLFQPFIDAFRGRFVFYSMYTCTYTIFIIEYRRFDRFFWVQQVARERWMYCHLWLEPGLKKASKYSYSSPNTYPIHSIKQMCSNEALWCPNAAPISCSGGYTAI